MTIDDIDAAIEDKKRRKCVSDDQLEIISLALEIRDLEKQRDEIVSFANQAKAWRQENSHLEFVGKVNHKNTPSI